MVQSINRRLIITSASENEKVFFFTNETMPKTEIRRNRIIDSDQNPHLEPLEI